MLIWLLLRRGISALLLALLILPAVAADQDQAALAKQLSNPVASLVSVPVQVNYDENYGSTDLHHRKAIDPSTQYRVDIRLGRR